MLYKRLTYDFFFPSEVQFESVYIIALREKEDSDHLCR